MVLALCAGSAACIRQASPADPKRINKLIERLRSLRLRDRAESDLAKIGGPAVPDLIRALKDEDSGVRWRAADGLASIGPAAQDESAARLTKPDSCKERVMRISFLSAAAVLALACGCEKKASPTMEGPAPAEKQIEVQAPGVDVKVEPGKGVEVQAPGVEVETAPKNPQ